MLEGTGAPLPEGTPIVSLAVGPENMALQFLRGEVLRAENDILAIVLSPILVENPSFLVQIRV